MVASSVRCRSVLLRERRREQGYVLESGYPGFRDCILRVDYSADSPPLSRSGQKRVVLMFLSINVGAVLLLPTVAEGLFTCG